MHKIKHRGHYLGFNSVVVRHKSALYDANDYMKGLTGAKALEAHIILPADRSTQLKNRYVKSDKNDYKVSCNKY